MSGWSGSVVLTWLMILAPLALGLVVGFAKPESLIVRVEAFSNWLEARFHAAAASKGFFSSYVARPMLWGLHKLHTWTSSMEPRSKRAATRAAAFFYVVGLTVLVTYLAVSLVLFMALLIAVVWIAGKAMGASSGGGSSEARWKEPAPSLAPHPKFHTAYAETSRQNCKCAPACGTFATITRWNCGCVDVELHNEELADDGCTNFTGMREHCGKPGRAVTA